MKNEEKLIPSKKWVWLLDEIHDVNSEASVSLQETYLLWETTPDHDNKFGGYLDRQELSDFITALCTLLQSQLLKNLFNF